MNENDDNRLNQISKMVIGSAFQVSNILGIGFLEKVYENALAHEIRKNGLRADQQSPIPVFYDGILVGDYVADLLVENRLLVELKVVKSIELIHHAQCINYLKATGLELCLLLNFGKTRVEVKRIALSDPFKSA
ncbi:MAG TPA: GxxExxY protein [Anaerolinea sp.]|nr:GxxExxY protein [Anaerolinea sp.]